MGLAKLRLIPNSEQRVFARPLSPPTRHPPTRRHTPRHTPGPRGSCRARLRARGSRSDFTHVNGLVGVKDVTSNASLTDNIANGLQKNLISATIKAGVGVAISGGDPGQAFVSALRLAAGDTIGSALANEIGTYAAFKNISDGDIVKVVLHATAGCAAGAASSGDCVAGAIGSGLSELLGKPMADAIKDPAEQTAILSLIAGTGAALTNKDINTAADTAGLTHQYNYLSHSDLIALLNAKSACAEGDTAACNQASTLQQKDDEQQKEWVGCRANPSDPSCKAVFLKVAVAISSYSGTTSIVFTPEERAAALDQISDQLLKFAAPEGVNAVSRDELAKSLKILSLVTLDPTGITATPDLIATALSGDPTAIMQLITAIARTKVPKTLPKVPDDGTTTTDPTTVKTDPKTPAGPTVVDVSKLSDSEYEAYAKANNYLHPDGTPRYPRYDGFAEPPQKVPLKEGTKIDRYGDNLNADFFSPIGTPFEARSPPPGAETRKLVTYEVIKPFEVDSGKAAEWFGHPGGGTQFKTPMTLEQLLEGGFIKEIKP